MLLPIDLMEKIKHTKRKHATFIIGIDGFGGAGKTTLSVWLRENLDNVSIVLLDDFYSPELNGADIGRISKQVFLSLENDLDAKFQMFDWRTNALTDWSMIKPGGIVIVEGVSALY
jgi:uridine kinase